MRRLLLIEDMAMEAEVLTRLYQMFAARFHDPVEIVNASTLGAGIMEMERTPFDVALLDLGLPDSPTDDTVQWLRDNAPKWPPIIVVTGQDVREKELRIACIRDGGASDFILKKVAHRDCEQLVERVWHAHLRRQYARR